MRDALDQFRQAIRSAGLIPPDMIEPDGKLRRFSSNGKRGDDAGWYVLHGDGIPAGSFGDWRNGLSESWRVDIGRKLTPAENAAHRAKVEAMRKQREADEDDAHEAAANKAVAIWKAATPATEDHAYLTRKRIKANGARLHKDALVIPMRDGGELHSLQFIGPDGDKRFLTGGRVTGCYFSIGNPKSAAALCIAEGFATGATIHEATGYPVAVAFNAGNLVAVAKAMRERFAELPLILCADDDVATEGNPGMTKATEAARSVGGLLAIPDFGTDRPENATDFNDLHQAQGLEAVGRAVANASAPAREVHQPYAGNAAAGDPAGTEWPEPLPLVAKVQPEPYPLDALPDTIRAAVIEVQGFTKAPVPMVASSALAALSLAIQANADVSRADKLSGPTSLFLLTIADSGERKSTCDGFFTSAIREYQEQQAEAAGPAVKDFRAKLDAWEAKRGGIKEKIRQLAKIGKQTAEQEAALRDLEDEKPEAPRVPRLLRGDDTPENLAWVLSREWPSAGVLSSEAGIVLGAHAMGKDSIMRNLGLLNILWDGGTLSIGRRTSESFNVHGARLTVALQVQEATLRSFFDRSGGLARGSGFLARFLVAWPESTQGFRPFTEAPANWPHLAAFNRRISKILNQPAPIDDDGALTPPMLPLTTEAKVAWVEFHDAIEGELASGGELYDVRDVASKSADNAARLAALFQIFEGGGGAVGLEAFESAGRIAAWHLNESRRFFGELALPAELAGAVRLDSWLIEYCRRERTHIVPRREVQRCGPNGLREKAALAEALRELAEAGRVLVVHDGRRKEILVNPALVIEGGAA
jgi:putative DNA primase/helicase